MIQCKYCGAPIAKPKYNQITCGEKPCTLAATRDRNKANRSKPCIICKTQPATVRRRCKQCNDKYITKAPMLCQGVKR